MVVDTRSPETRPNATYQDIIDAPEHKVAEIIDGTLYLSPRPPFGAARAKQALLLQLHRPFDRGEGSPGGWWLLREPEFYLGTDVLVPDLVGGAVTAFQSCRMHPAPICRPTGSAKL